MRNLSDMEIDQICGAGDPPGGAPATIVTISAAQGLSTGLITAAFALAMGSPIGWVVVGGVVVGAVTTGGLIQYWQNITTPPTSGG